MTMALPNPMQKLPWNVRKERERNARKLKLEGAKLFRELGISEDATFEEIQEATQRALMKIDPKDLKAKIKIEVTKDKILQLRLNQRLGGMLSQTREARADGYLKDDAVNYEKELKKRGGWEPPAWTRGLVVKPNEQWRDNCVIFFGTIAALGFFIPTSSNGLQFFTFILGTGFMAQRGAPPAEPGMGMGYRRRVGAHTFLALGLAFFTYAFSAAFSSAFIRSALPHLVENPISNSIQTIIVSTCMGFATAYLQPYRPGGGGASGGKRKSSTYGDR